MPDGGTGNCRNFVIFKSIFDWLFTKAKTKIITEKTNLRKMFPNNFKENWKYIKKSFTVKVLLEP